jgi:hypothetical protein
MTLSLAGDLLVRRRPPRRDASGQPVFRLQVSRNGWLAANRTINSGYSSHDRSMAPASTSSHGAVSRSSEARASRAAGFGWSQASVDVSPPAAACVPVLGDLPTRLQ